MEQEQKKKSRPFEYYVHIFHRDVGAFLVGLLMFFSLSGVVLVFRDTSFLKSTTQISKTLKPGISPKKLGKKLKIKKFKVEKVQGDVVFFRQGTYNKKTGKAEYRLSKLIFPFDRLTSLHKASTKHKTYIIIVIFGLLTFLMALSSLWMLKRGHRFYKRNLMITGAGMLFALILLLL